MRERGSFHLVNLLASNSLSVALRNGDPQAVLAMYQLLMPGLRAPGSSEKKFKKQLRDEYGVDVDLVENLGECPQPTDAEVSRAGAIMMKSKHVSIKLRCCNSIPQVLTRFIR